MTADELADILELAYAESGQKPTLSHAAIWWEALGNHPASSVHQAVVSYLASHKWPPKASEIADRLHGVDDHAKALASRAIQGLVAAGVMHPVAGRTLDSSDFNGDEVALRTHQTLGRQIWYSMSGSAAVSVFETTYDRLSSERLPPIVELGKGPDEPPEFQVPIIGKEMP